MLLTARNCFCSKHFGLFYKPLTFIAPHGKLRGESEADASHLYSIFCFFNGWAC